MNLTDENGASWLIDTLCGTTGGDPLSSEEIRYVEPNEVVGTRFVAHQQANQLLFKLPEELPGGEVVEAEFLITVQRVVR